MPLDSSDIDAAILAKLSSDTTLLGYMPHGVWWDLAPPPVAGTTTPTRFVVVSLADELDVPHQGARSYEDVLYLVKAVALAPASGPQPQIKQAAARIDELLDPQPPAGPPTLTVAGYRLMKLERESRVRYTEVDEVDPTIRWYHRGGNYRVQLSTLP